MKFLLLAYDGTDDGAHARRMAVREQHLHDIKPLAEAGRLDIGGMLLGEGDAILGSMLVFEAEDEAAARARVEDDVYTREGVWVRYELMPFKRSV